MEAYHSIFQEKCEAVTQIINEKSKMNFDVFRPVDLKAAKMICKEDREDYDFIFDTKNAVLDDLAQWILEGVDQNLSIETSQLNGVLYTN